VNPARTTLRKETEWQRRQRRARERAEHVAEHGPACQICGNVPKRGLDQDHDHKTGLTRGWLCHRCNRALPNWVTYLWLLKAARYVFRARHGTKDGPIELDLLIEAEEEEERRA
jgi:Recombination endonuclease VII